jgi:ubiquinol-cytochrome c reductase cytochrome b subunit
LPFVIVGLVALHIWALHVPGSNNPAGIEVRNEEKETLPFHPYFTTKDALAMVVFGMLFAYLVFYVPNYLGDAVNYVPANQLVTPPHIVPEWYFLPFYAILRAIPSKLGGVLLMFSALVVLFFVPWLDTSRVKSTTYRPIYRWFFLALVIDVLALGYLGAIPPEGNAVIAARLFTLYYFAHFLVVMPIVGLIETPRPVPSTISETFTHKVKGSDEDIRAVPAE